MFNNYYETIEFCQKANSGRSWAIELLSFFSALPIPNHMLASNRSTGQRNIDTNILAEIDDINIDFLFPQTLGQLDELTVHNTNYIINMIKTTSKTQQYLTTVNCS